MNILIVGGLIIVVFFLFIILFCEHAPKKYILVSFFIFISLLGWMITSVMQPWKIDSVEVLDIYDVDSVKVVSISNKIGPQLINLNEVFNKQIPQGSKVKLIRYKTGYYVGIDYSGMDIKMYKLELIKDADTGSTKSL